MYNVGGIDAVLKEVCLIGNTSRCFVNGVEKWLIFRFFCSVTYNLRICIVLPNWNIFYCFSFLFRFFILSLQSISIRSR